MSSSPLSEVEEPDRGNKRRSARVTRKPEVFTETFGSAKRKRAAADDDENEVSEDEDGEESPSEIGEEDEPDEEELKAQRARKPKNAPKKPAAKRAKPNGNAVHLPIRSTTTKVKRPQKKGKAPAVAGADEAGGLYA